MTRTDDGLLHLCTRDDLADLCECWDGETGDYIYTSFAYIDPTRTIWYGKMDGVSRCDLTIDHIKRALERVPDEEVYPEAPPFITVLHSEDKDAYYIKRPGMADLEDAEQRTDFACRMLEEAKTFEVIAKSPHPNLALYYGCVLKDGLITGIALEKYRTILLHRCVDGTRGLNIAAIMKGLRAGIDHLHSIGLAHNHLNPDNIALDQVENPVILGLGSCKALGQELMSDRTLSWYEQGDECHAVSSQSHDDFALTKLEEWLIHQESKRSSMTSDQNKYEIFWRPWNQTKSTA